MATSHSQDRCHTLSKMNIRLILVFIWLFGMFSCTIPKEARLLKKTTEDWRKSPVVLEAYADSPLSGRFLTLRDNGKFEHTSSGLLRSFQAGIWTSNQDTINLSYIDNNQKETNWFQANCISGYSPTNNWRQSSCGSSNNYILRSFSF